MADDGAYQALRLIISLLSLGSGNRFLDIFTTWRHSYEKPIPQAEKVQKIKFRIFCIFLVFYSFIFRCSMDETCSSEDTHIEVFWDGEFFEKGLVFLTPF